LKTGVFHSVGLKNIFCRNFWSIGQIFGKKSTSDIPKFEESLGKNSKIWRFFFQVWLKVSHHAHPKSFAFYLVLTNTQDKF
jgi:hypothetical protein